MLEAEKPDTRHSFPKSAPASFDSAMAAVEPAVIGASLLIKGEISGVESLHIDGRIEGTITFPEHRVTIGRKGNVVANIKARDVVVMGRVEGNIEGGDRVDIRGEAWIRGDIVTQRISIEDGAVVKGSVAVRPAEQKADHDHKAEQKNEKPQNRNAAEPMPEEKTQPALSEGPKPQTVQVTRAHGSKVILEEVH
jgi:cytoskeletal protein CcmA (bactofilin family)